MLVKGKLWDQNVKKTAASHANIETKNQKKKSKTWASSGPLKLYKELKSMIVRIKIKIIFKISTNKNNLYKQRYRKQ